MRAIKPPRDYNMPKLNEWDVKEMLHDIVTLALIYLKKTGFIDASEFRTPGPPMDRLWVEFVGVAAGDGTNSHERLSQYCRGRQ